MKRDDRKIRKSLNISIQEGSAASVSSSFGDSYVSTFATAVAEKINPANTGLQIGILSAISSLASPLAQIYGSKLMSLYERKKIVSLSVFIQALLWIPLALTAFLFYYEKIGMVSIYAIILIYTLIAIAGGISYPPWFSWMGDLVPEKHRGKYFAKRNRIIGLVGLVAVAVGALAMYYSEKSGLAIICFGALFILASIFRYLSLKKLRSQYVPEFKQREGTYFSIFEFLKRHDNYGKFAIYQLFFNIAIMIASPFFIVYMKQNLNFSYSLIILISMSSSAFYLIFSSLAGKISDKYGNLNLMYLANICFVASPLLWLVWNNPIYLIIIPQLVAGLGNSALVLATTNFTYDAVSPQKRGICVAYTNILIGIGAFIGSIAGGLLLKYSFSGTAGKFVFLFLLAAAMRLLVFFIFLPTLREVKKVSAFHPMHIKFVHPFKTIEHEIGHFFTQKQQSSRRNI